jgi:hypothetical protein
MSTIINIEEFPWRKETMLSANRLPGRLTRSSDKYYSIFVEQVEMAGLGRREI